jgi:hypothetical protein
VTLLKTAVRHALLAEEVAATVAGRAVSCGRGTSDQRASPSPALTSQYVLAPGIVEREDAHRGTWSS